MFALRTLPTPQLGGIPAFATNTDVFAITVFQQCLRCALRWVEVATLSYSTGNDFPEQFYPRLPLLLTLRF